MLSSWQNLGPSWKQRHRSRIIPYMLRRRLRCTWEDEYWAARIEGKVTFIPIVQSLRVEHIDRHVRHDNSQRNRRIFVFAISGPRSVRSSVTEQWVDWERELLNLRSATRYLSLFIIILSCMGRLSKHVLERYFSLLYSGLWLAWLKYFPPLISTPDLWTPIFPPSANPNTGESH